jgi:hypothetical protein
VGLVPARGLGVPRRAALFALLAWAPTAALALLAGDAFAGGPESFMQHFGVHVRCLLAIPLLVAGEALAETRLPPAVRHFVDAGVVAPRDGAAFDDALAAAGRARDSAVAAAVLVVVAFLGLLRIGPAHDDVAWAWAPDGRLLAAGWWYVVVARPLFAFLVGLWLWRLVVLGFLLLRVARLELALVPTHADAAAGLGFLGEVPVAFVPAVAATSSVIAAGIAHDVLHHGRHVQDSLWLLGIWTALVVGACVVPLLAFTPRLAALRATALREYGALVARHGRLVDRRWIRGEQLPDDTLLHAPEIGPVADTIALYGAVEALRPVPLGVRAVVPLALAALVPMLPVVLLEVPLRQILLRLGRALL